MIEALKTYMLSLHSTKFQRKQTILTPSMTSFFPGKIWEEYLRPLILRPRRLQVAALCLRGSDDNREVLLITSRDTGRWIIPKGWPIRGLSSKETALREAWEEAGVKEGVATKDPIGTYHYNKRRDSGMTIPVETLVYSVAVKEISDKFPEAGERTQQWVNAETAANLVDEPELKEIFLNQ